VSRLVSEPAKNLPETACPRHTIACLTPASPGQKVARSGHWPGLCRRPERGSIRPLIDAPRGWFPPPRPCPMWPLKGRGNGPNSTARKTQRGHPRGKCAPPCPPPSARVETRPFPPGVPCPVCACQPLQLSARWPQQRDPSRAEWGQEPLKCEPPCPCPGTGFGSRTEAIGFPNRLIPWPLHGAGLTPPDDGQGIAIRSPPCPWPMSTAAARSSLTPSCPRPITGHPLTHRERPICPTSRRALAQIGLSSAALH